MPDDSRSTLRAAAHRARNAVEYARWSKRFQRFGPGSRLRAPRCITNGRRITIGRKVYIRAGARLEVVPVSVNVEAVGNIALEDHVQIGDFVHIAAVASVRVGSGTLIGSYVYITDHDHGLPAGLTPVYREPLLGSAVVIGRCAWIGESAVILKGVTVGDGAVIGAHAVVTADVPPGAVCVGVPARVVRMRDGWTSPGVELSDGTGRRTI